MTLPLAPHRRFNALFVPRLALMLRRLNVSRAGLIARCPQLRASEINNVLMQVALPSPRLIAIVARALGLSRSDTVALYRAAAHDLGFDVGELDGAQ